jgi:hypothetical protein
MGTRQTLTKTAAVNAEPDQAEEDFFWLTAIINVLSANPFGPVSPF